MNLVDDLTLFIKPQREDLETEDIGCDDLPYKSHNEDDQEHYEIIEEGIEEGVENMENDGNIANKMKTKSQQPAKCQICNKILSSRYHLKEHIENVHEKIKNFSCTQCPKTFYRKYHLASHIAYRHTLRTTTQQTQIALSSVASKVAASSSKPRRM
jgi:uncharacterized Zn-finger protein